MEPSQIHIFQKKEKKKKIIEQQGLTDHKGRLEDECEDLVEDLWCCKSAYVDQSPGWRLNVMVSKRIASITHKRRETRVARKR